MKTVEQSVTFLGETPYEEELMLKHVETAGRICYQSWSNVDINSHVKFCSMLYKHKHWAMLEHSNIVIELSMSAFTYLRDHLAMETRGLAFLNFASVDDKVFCASNITGWLNTIARLKTLHEFPLGILQTLESTLHSFLPSLFGNPDVQFEIYDVITNPDKIPNKLKRFSFRIVTNRGITHELVRHRPCSFGQESSRWIKYDDLTFCKSTVEGSDHETDLLAMFHTIEDFYRDWHKDVKTDKLRGILPNDTKTEIIITADLEEFEHIIKLRGASDAHYQIQYIANEIEKALLEVR